MEILDMDIIGRHQLSLALLERMAPNFSGHREITIKSLLAQAGAPITNAGEYDSKYFWYREDTVPGEWLEISWGNPETNNHCAHTAAQADLEYRIDNDAGFREATDSLTKHLAVGDIVKEVYEKSDGSSNETLYIIESISQDSESGHIVWHIQTSQPDRDGYQNLNSFVYVNGEIKQLFGNNSGYLEIVTNPPEKYTNKAPTEKQFGLF